MVHAPLVMVAVTAWFIYTTNMTQKLFAVLNQEDIITDVWCAETLEEAQSDNPMHTVIEMTLENSPQVTGEKWKGKK